MKYTYRSVYIVIAMTVASAQAENESKSLGSFVAKNALLGAIAGGLEVTVNQPLVTIKNSLQQRLPIAFDRTLYKGYMVNAGSMGPITAAQVTVYALIKKQFESHGRALSDAQNLGAGFAAGAVSGLVSGPAELIMLKQKNSGKTLQQAFTDVMRQKGVAGLWRGFVPAAMRDGGFTMGYLALGDVFKNPIKKIVHDERLASLTAGICAGLVVAPPTHPFDTIKTIMQAEDITLKQAMYKKYRSHGVQGFFDGLSPRAFRILLAIPLMSMVKYELSLHLDL